MVGPAVVFAILPDKRQALLSPSVSQVASRRGSDHSTPWVSYRPGASGAARSVGYTASSESFSALRLQQLTKVLKGLFGSLAVQRALQRRFIDTDFHFAPGFEVC